MQRGVGQIIDYFHQFIFGFIYHDIERCIEAKANYVVALALLSCTEFIGGLISGNLGLKNKSKDNFDEALKYFPGGYKDIDSELTVEYVNEDGVAQIDNGLYSLFRCGVVHEYFPKGVDVGVLNYPDGQTNGNRIGIQVTPPQGEPQRKLHLFRNNEYFRDFKFAVDKVYKGLIVDCDPKLLEGFNRSLDRIYSRRII